MTRLVNEADIVNKTRPLFTLSLEMTRLVNQTRLLLVPCVNSDIYGSSLWDMKLSKKTLLGCPFQHKMSFSESLGKAWV